jgi:hypothetical protein
MQTTFDERPIRCRWCDYVVPNERYNRDGEYVLRQHCYEQAHAERQAGGPVTHVGPLVPR